MRSGSDPDPDRPATLPRRTLLRTTAASGAAALAGCGFPGDLAVRRTTTTVDVASGTAVTAENTNGDVTVETGDGEAVVVELEKRTRDGADRLEDVTVESARSDGGLAISVAYGPRARGGAVIAHLTVSLPAGTTLDGARTVNGDVAATGVAGDPALETTNGTVRAGALEGFVSLQATNGDLESTDVGGLDRAVTTNGDVDLAVPAIRQDVDVLVLNGDVELALGDLDARVVATTENGEVGASGVAFEDLTVTRTRIEGTLGAGTHELRISTRRGEVGLQPL